jgi:hypothetical protein
MHLVDEQDYVAGFLDLVDGGLDSFLKVASVFRTGHHARKVERYYSFAAQVLRHISGYNLLGKTFRDGCFSDAGLPDQNRVVFGAAA